MDTRNLPDSDLPKQVRVAVYARTSTAHHGQDPEVQLRELREYCGRRHWTVTEYVDSGYSGSKDSRPELNRMLKACHRRMVDHVVVYRYDRFARSLRQLVNALDEFRSLDIGFVSIHEGVDTSTANGRLVFGIFASIAEFERELTRDRVRSGLRAARARGVCLGRPRVKVDVERITDLRSQGTGWKKIAAQLGIGVGTVLRAVQRAS